MKVKSSVVIVTGASAGIGAAIARQLAYAGAHVVLVARREDRLQILANELTGFSGKRIVIAGDITDQSFVADMVAQVIEQFGRIDTVINNAGMGHHSDIAEITADHMEMMTDLNVYAPIHIIQAVLPTMLTQKRGQIINVSSIVSVRPLPHLAYYTATKAALDHITRGLRIELHQSPIVMTTLYPGRTKSEFQQVKLGEADSREPTGVSAEKVAKVTLQAIEKDKKEVYVTLFDRFFTMISRHFPWLTDHVICRLLYDDRMRSVVQRIRW